MNFFISTIKTTTALLSGLLFILITCVEPVSAYESFASGSSTLKCQTTCHQAENLLKTHREKENKAECRSCHVGEHPSKTQSPFQASEIIQKTSVSSFRPSSHLVSAIKKESLKPVSKNKEKSSASSNPPDMALIPAGEFIMGSNERWDDESPEHIASTDAFFIDLYEVTNENYKKFVEATKREAPYHWPNGEIPKEMEKHPVVYVSWFDARDYCEWSGKRLPNEQEWEKASRGEDGFTYPWGHEWSLDKSNNPYKYSTGTVPVGSYPEGRSPYGLYDMSGNVWEWVDSYYLPHPGNTVQRAEYGKDKRILKGGSWFDCLSYGCGLSAPTFNRSFFTPEVRNNSFGFRCAKSP
jgi:formylglycine-generating enzyme required for sulfatase activity